jgi:uncharacterized protein (UPF0264 family)
VSALPRDWRSRIADSPNGVPVRPRLLVSVRNVEEATAAIAGGCDWLDIKEPAHGPLGRPDSSVAVAIQDWLGDSPALPCSAAIGEMVELLHGRTADRADARKIASRLAVVKTGLAGCADRPEWEAELEGLVGELPTELIAVTYADHEAAGAPQLAATIKAASRAGCLGVLVDTWDKRGSRLLDCLSIDELGHFRRQAHAAGLMFSVAGRLDLPAIQSLVRCGCDVIGVRSAACRSGDRNSAISTEAVAELAALLDAAAGTPLTAG